MIEKTNEKIYQSQVLVHEYDIITATAPDTHVIEIWTVQGLMIAKTEIKKPKDVENFNQS